jgi:hypothetical protein
MKILSDLYFVVAFAGLVTLTFFFFLNGIEALEIEPNVPELRNYWAVLCLVCVSWFVGRITEV